MAFRAVLAIALVSLAAAQPCAAQDPARRTLAAQRLEAPLVFDGRLDEEIYQRVTPTTGFIQQEPREGALSTEQTEVWVLFDDDTIYVGARCLDSQPQREVATELRRDNGNIINQDNFAVIFDTFHDLRNGLQFQTTPIGAMRDSAIVDSVSGGEAWNTIWDVRTNRSDRGFTVEMAIPFKSLRYASAGPQIWGLNVRRIIKWKNEIAYLTALPAAFGMNALSHMELAATLTGIETPRQSMNLELKPYAASSLTTDLAARTPFENDGKGNVGFDFKYGLTRGLILDATVNTDFAQVEEDQQQVNLTRFSLFFPEKRDFFLESQGNFAFGGASTNGNPGDLPVLFFSRQIGISKGQSVPVIGGARLTGRAGRYQIGAVNIVTGDNSEASAVTTNFTAIRIKRDFLRRSNIGIIATSRTPTAGGSDTNLAFGVDANLLLFSSVSANAFYARTESPDSTQGQASYRGRIDFAGDRWGWTGEHLLIGPDFNPEVGYVRRTDFRRSFGQFRFSPRPMNSRRVRKYSYTGSLDYITDAGLDQTLERELHGTFNTDYQNGDALNVDYARNYELVDRSFDINPGTNVPAGGYDYQNLRAQYSLGQQHKISGRLFVAYGSLYEGTKTEAGYGGRVAIIPQFSLEPSVTLNWVRLPYGDFEAPVISTRIIFTPNSRTALTSFLQYNGGSRTLSMSARLRWEYRGGSEIFIVYSDGRSTTEPGYPALVNRSVALKVTRLLRF